MFLSGLAALADVPVLSGLPAPAANRSEPYTSHRLPTGPFQRQILPLEALEGRLTQYAWQHPRDGRGSLELLAPLRQDLQLQGYETLYACDTSSCGGYDFRFNLDLLPEPDMHVDLGDFRYVLGRKGDEWAALLVSNSATISFIHLTHIDTAAKPAPRPMDQTGIQAIPQTAIPLSSADPATATSVGPSGPFDATGRFVLGDLVFASGAPTLASGEYASLAALAQWLQSNPEGRVALVGHTDASGGLEANIALSRKRAEAVRQELIGRFKIPANRLSAAQGVGPLAPLVSHQDDGKRQINRRVEAIWLGVGGR